MARCTVKIQRTITLPMTNQFFAALFAKYPAFENIRIIFSALSAPLFPLIPDRLPSFPQCRNFIKQFPADNRRMIVRHHAPAFPWIFSDFPIRFIVGNTVVDSCFCFSGTRGSTAGRPHQRNRVHSSDRPDKTHLA